MAVSSKQITTDLMAYLRGFRRMYLLATEVKYNHCRSDVLAVDNKAIVEFEVKVSKADFLKDFDKHLVLGYRKWKTSVPKHAMYNGKVASEKKYFVPHFFYFVVPADLVKVVKEKCKDYPKYGIILWDPSYKYRVGIVKSAKPLTNEPPNKSVVQKILRRATNELVSLRAKLYSQDLIIEEDPEEGDDEQEELELPKE